MKNKLAIYAGSFNPFHVGHLDVLEKTQSLFENVVVLLGQNPAKPIDENMEYRAGQLRTKLNIDARTFDGSLINAIVDVGNDLNIHEYVLVRGLRNGYDLDVELNQYEFLKTMWPELEIVFIPCDKQFNHVSSSAIRALELVDENTAKWARSQFCV